MSIRAMKRTTLAYAITALFVSSGAIAQSTSKVDTQNINQTQAGMLQQQELTIGNANQGGQSNVQVSNVTQGQAGMLQRQKMAIGDADKGKSDVKSGPIMQGQVGMLNNQE